MTPDRTPWGTELFGPVLPGAIDTRDAFIGGIVPFSTVDWPGQLAMVVFMAGCPWRCHYCHNPHLQTRVRPHMGNWRRFHALLHARRSLLDAVVFSGGEPLVEPALPQLIGQARDMGFKIGLHTAGIYPRQLTAMQNHIDWIGLDIKTTPQRYDALTGRRDSWAPVASSLARILDSGIDFECRTTWDPMWLPEAELVVLGETLANLGVRHYAVQRCRPAPDQPPTATLSQTAHDRLSACMVHFEVR